MVQSSKTILLSIIFGILFGKILTLFSESSWFYIGSIEIVDTGAKLFLRLIKMLVIPVVSISIICGISQLKDSKKLGSMGLEAILLYLSTTAIAITIAIITAKSFSVGSNINTSTISNIQLAQPPSFKETLINWIPINPISAMAESKMLQIIIFAAIFGLAINHTRSSELIVKFFTGLNEVMMTCVSIVMKASPLGIFCLLTILSTQTSPAIIKSLGLYAFCVTSALLTQAILVYGSLLKLSNRKPIDFFKKIFPAQLFAFSTASSSASIPVVLATVREKIGVNQEIANFVIPLGATINMDGTAIMQGVATIFIANFYGINLYLPDFLAIIGMATIASVGTAGVPGVGLITLAMVLEQVGIPIQGIALIVGIDRILDMLRTAINITGDATIAAVIARKRNK